MIACDAPFPLPIPVLTLALLGVGNIQSQSTGTDAATNQTVASAQTVAYCDLEHSEKFTNQMIRVRAMYETDFEKSVITSLSCPTPLPMTWVTFDDHWKRRTTRGLRKTVSQAKWDSPLDVVFIGKLKTGGLYGQMDMYSLSLEGL